MKANIRVLEEHNTAKTNKNVYGSKCGIWLEVAVSGGYYRKFMEITGVHTRDLKDGIKKELGKSYLSTPNMNLT